LKRNRPLHTNRELSGPISREVETCMNPWNGESSPYAVNAGSTLHRRILNGGMMDGIPNSTLTPT